MIKVKKLSIFFYEKLKLALRIYISICCNFRSVSEIPELCERGLENSINYVQKFWKQKSARHKSYKAYCNKFNFVRNSMIIAQALIISNLHLHFYLKIFKRKRKRERDDACAIYQHSYRERIYVNKLQGLRFRSIVPFRARACKYQLATYCAAINRASTSLRVLSRNRGLTDGAEARIHSLTRKFQTSKGGERERI